MLPTIVRRRMPAESPTEMIREEMDRVFGHMFGPWLTPDGGQRAAAYPVDIREDNGNIHVEAELPGFKKDEIEITLQQGVVSITAERKPKEVEAPGKVHLNERRFVRVERCFTLPENVDESEVDAQLEDGVLHLTLHKTKESMAHKITVK